MNRYKVTLYEGDILAQHIDKVIKELILSADSIDQVNATIVLANSGFDLDALHYLRYTLISKDVVTVDYGKHYSFIKIERVE